MLSFLDFFCEFIIILGIFSVDMDFVFILNSFFGFITKLKLIFLFVEVFCLNKNYNEFYLETTSNRKKCN